MLFYKQRELVETPHPPPQKHKNRDFEVNNWVVKYKKKKNQCNQNFPEIE